MYLELQKRLRAHLRAVLRRQIRTQPRRRSRSKSLPTSKFGELSTPIAFELARKLRKAPENHRPGDGRCARHRAGLCRIRSRRRRIHQRPPRSRASAASIASSRHIPRPPTGIHSLVEHTSINPNKAAHIGHLRNAILGDTFVRLLRAAGHKVGVQNYIDNTGVQVADVVVGFVHLEGKSHGRSPPAELMTEPPGRTHRLLLLGPLRAQPRSGTTQGTRRREPAASRFATTRSTPSSTAATKPPRSPTSSPPPSCAAISKPCSASASSTTSCRAKARSCTSISGTPPSQLKPNGVLYFETEGKNKGCWVMRRAGNAEARPKAEARRRRQGHRPLQRHRHLRRQRHRLSPLEVRPARQRLRLSSRSIDYPDRRTCWISTDQRESSPHPALRRRASHLQRHRRAPERSAEQRHRRPCAAWATPIRPTTTPTSPTRWSP